MARKIDVLAYCAVGVTIGAALGMTLRAPQAQKELLICCIAGSAYGSLLAGFCMQSGYGGFLAGKGLGSGPFTATKDA